MKTIHSVRDGNGNVYQKTPTGGVGRQRCMKCQGLCTMKTLADGKSVMSCGGCGAQYTTGSMDGHQQAKPGVVPRKVPPQTPAPRSSVTPTPRHR